MSTPAQPVDPQDVKEVQSRLTQVEDSLSRLKERWDALKNRDVFNLLLITLPRMLQAERCSVFIVDPESGQLWLEAGTGVVERQICVEAGASMVGQAVTTQKPIRAEGLEARPGAHVAVGDRLHFHVRSALTVPVRDPANGTAVGALQVLNRLGDTGFTAADEVLLSEIAFAVQPSIQQLYASQQLLREAEWTHREIAILRDRERALRPGHMFRTFEPLERLGDRGFLHTRYQEKRYPPFISPSATRHLKATWDTDEHDVLICTHQKVGTHLAKKLLVEIERANATEVARLPYADGDIGHGAVPWPEVLFSQEGEAAWTEFMTRSQLMPRLWYTHCAYEDLPVRRIHPRTRFVVVVREPKAAAVSQFYFWLRHPLLGVNPRMDITEFSALFTEGGLYFGGYHEHAAGWIQRSDARVADAQVCLLFYEDMVERKPDVIRKLQAFLHPGRELPIEQVGAIAAASEFNAMKEELTANPRSFHLNPQLYFRSGTTDDWKAKLTPEAIARIDAATRTKWAGGPEPLKRYLASASITA